MLTNQDRNSVSHNSRKTASVHTSACSVGPLNSSMEKGNAGFIVSVHQIKVFQAAWCSPTPGERVAGMVGEGKLSRSSQSPGCCCFLGPGCPTLLEHVLTPPAGSWQWRALIDPPSWTQAELICRRSYECLLKQENSPTIFFLSQKTQEASRCRLPLFGNE